MLPDTYVTLHRTTRAYDYKTKKNHRYNADDIKIILFHGVSEVRKTFETIVKLLNFSHRQ